MKASNRSPPGRPNPTSAKAEVNKVAGQGKDKTESRQVQDRTKDGRDKAVDVKQVQDRAKDGTQGHVKTTEARQQDKTPTRQGQDKIQTRQVEDKTQTRQGQDKIQTRQVEDKTQVRQVQGSVTKGSVPQTNNGDQVRDSIVNAGQIPDKKDDKKNAIQPMNEVEAKNPVLNNEEVKYNDVVANVAEVKHTDVNYKVTNDVTAVTDAPSDGLIQDHHHDDIGQVNDSVSDAGNANQVQDKNSDKGQPETQENDMEQRSIDIIPNNVNDDQTKERDRETSPVANDLKNDMKKPPQANSDESTNQRKETTSDVQHRSSSEQTKPANSDSTQRPASQTVKTTIKVTPEDGTDDEDEDRQDMIARQKNDSHIHNGNSHNRMTRSRHKRNETRRRYDDDDEESDDYGDHLAMDNELVRHLLPHMSPALLPKALQPQNRARDSSSNSEDEHIQHKLSLNVIKESFEDENGGGENNEQESDDEIILPPPTTLASTRRHSFHHFPAPPTKSQSKNAEKVRALLQAVEEEELEKISKKLGDKTDLVKQHLGPVENRIFEMFGNKEKKTININKFLMGLTAAGMRPSDPRLKQTRNNLKKLQEDLGSEFISLEVDYETFMGIISENLEIVVKAFSGSFVIPDFQGFCKKIEDLYNRCYANHTGKPAQYIPQLARCDSKSWGVSVCTVDGQRFSMGDVDVPFTIQSCSKPLTYAIGLAVNGTDYMHNYVGMEPSGRYFNELVLDYSNKPHNPMINSGAIMTAALIKPELSAADRFDFIFKVYKRLAGNEHLGFNNSVFLSERECADRNFALAYFMRENKCFPPNHKLQESLDFYFQLCSLEITAESGAVIAATLANGGLNPLNNDPVLTTDAVRNTLTLMHSCGMYNYSGQFAFHVGLPAKSGVSGCVLLVIPNTMGICLWSPPLDSNGNSCRGVQFCMEMVSRFNFHNFDNLRGFSKSKEDPRTANTQSKAQVLFELLFTAAAGDLSALKRHSLEGTDMQAKDYDGRTALHVATSEGHDEMVDFLLNNCNVNPLPKDRWDRTPLDDAESFDHLKCAKLITDCCKRKGIKLPISYKEYMKLTNNSNGPLLLVNSN